MKRDFCNIFLVSPDWYSGRIPVGIARIPIGLAKLGNDRARENSNCSIYMNLLPSRINENLHRSKMGVFVNTEKNSDWLYQIDSRGGNNWNFSSFSNLKIVSMKF